MKLLIPPPIIALLCSLAMWGIAETFSQTRFAFPFQSALAGAFIVVGLAIDLISIGAFRKAKTTVTPLAPEKATSLVVTGVYRHTRNPMYLGLLLILSGIAIWLGSPVNGAILIAFVGYITAFQIAPEEARLTKLFGSDYERYRARVRRWL
ncbi:isoprenylcysteine carboxyl methyltransferase family protein [Erythrobacter sp. NAP1]|uniref:methyltransferase family protein n=1 Tax=Erythrobacter sp. NAP1 TaxID=237727 RepID=UPI0000686F77|nr:isoprenylcysteine carboxylmethyltransferase family protein [Erythrobacter sp. NAP1]EAQ29733.1 isoprenylcysteine carboxyl methyltransferase family protein [Erythrobacter sp. NAP1]